MKPPDLVTVPPAVVTITSEAPLLPVGVMIDSEVSLTIVKSATAPPTVTPVVKVKLVPEIVVEVPPSTDPVVIESDVIVGVGA